MQSNDVTGWKELLAIAVAINEGYTNDPNPTNYTASNQTLADLDMKITKYLCNIDQTYCANGPNAPVRILRNSVPSSGEQQQEEGPPTPFQLGP